jgi:small subunit ribosomal protein S3e
LALSSGEKGRRIRELTSVVQKRFNFPEGTVELYAEKVNNRGLCAIAQAESLRYKLLGGLAVRRYSPRPKCRKESLNAIRVIAVI